MAACSGLRRLALSGNGQCGVGLRRRTALAATASFDNWACSGLRRVAQLGWGHPMGYNIGRRRKRLPCLAALAAVAKCEGEAKRRSQPTVTAWWFAEICGSGASLLTTSTVTFETVRGGEYCGGRGKALACGVLFEVTQEVESNGGCGEDPARCGVAAAIARQSASGPDPMLFTPSRGVCCCSGIAEKGPAWRWPSKCGGVRFLRFLSALGPA